MAEGRHPFHAWVQLEQPRLGSVVTYATDEFFAAKERLIDPGTPEFIDGKYDDHGKWMDGWESRRKRTPGHDYCIVHLGVPGIVRGVDIDTSYFTGNYPPQASIDAAGDTSIDLLALENGGRAIACSDEHFGSMHNLNVAGRGVNMGDGWETARRRGPGNDWALLVLGHPGMIERIEVDTAHFKGNYPDRVSIEAGMFTVADEVTADSDRWRTVLPESKLEMDKQHTFASGLHDVGPVSHVRLSIYPDGGVSRLRVFGRPVVRSADT
jgi:allantoicase